MQFANSLSQIWRSDGVHPLVGTWRYLGWQFVRRWGRFPREIPVGRSRLCVREPSGVAALAYSMGMYDFHNMNLLRAELRSGDVFFDIGANIGIYSLIASETAGVAVHAFEPFSETFERLDFNLKENGRTAITHRVALSGHEGVARLALGRNRETNRLDDSSVDAFEEVPVARLDTFCAANGVRPTHVKLDVEGHELPVLEGGAQSMGEIALIIVEGGESPEKTDCLRAMGFEGPYYAHFPQAILNRSPQRRAEDPVFVRPERLRTVRVSE